MHYTEWIPALGEKACYTLDHKGYDHNQDGSDKSFLYYDKWNTWEKIMQFTTKTYI